MSHGYILMGRTQVITFINKEERSDYFFSVLIKAEVLRLYLKNDSKHNLKNLSVTTRTLLK